MHTVAIVGRPNVGKSTLFNRLIGERKSIVDDVSGVTRDRIYGEFEWGGRKFNLIDTGGFVSHSNEMFEKRIREQVKIAMQEAHALLFVVDVTTGITDLDDQLARLLHQSDKAVHVVVNKVDNSQRLYDSSEFYGMGFETIYPISAINGSGSGELLEAIIESIPDDDMDEDLEEGLPRIAVIGQPNVGKSSLVNLFIGEERQIVTEIAGTTRDSTHTRFNKFGRDIILIDTAGIRKKSKVHEDLEFYSVIRAVKAMDEADVCVLMLDATKGITTQDVSIFSVAARKKKGILIVVNKWDLIEKETNTARDYEKELIERIAPFRDVPIVFASVHDKQRTLKILDAAIHVFENVKRRITTSKLNDVMQEILKRFPPPVVKGKNPAIKYVTQLPTPFPAFAFFGKHPRYIKQNYRNYLENKMRENFDFKGAPIQIYFREKG